MGSLFKKTVTRPLPSGATIVTRGGQQHAQYTRRGRIVTSELTASGRIRTESATWFAKFRDGSDIVRVVSTGCRHKQAAMTVLTDLMATAEKVRSGILSSAESRIADHAHTLMTQHIADYIAHLEQRSVHPDRIKTTDTRLVESAAACGFRYLRDLNSDRLERWLSEQTISASVHNGYIEVWISFGFWLQGKRITNRQAHWKGERRLLSNPFDGMRQLDARQDRKRVARALTADELERLLDAASSRPLIDAQTMNRGPNKGERTVKLSAERQAALERLGQERRLIYKTALLTGLRFNELKTLTINSISFGDVPFIRLAAKNEKNRKGSAVPLRSDLASELKAWVAGRPSTDLVFTVPAGLLRIFNRDLKLANISKKDADGRVVHIHALRHSFGTALAAAGVAPRVAQAAMRHSDIRLTMSTYVDAGLLGVAEAMSSLDLVAPTVAQGLGSLEGLERSIENSAPLQEEGTSKEIAGKSFLSGVERRGVEPPASTLRT